VQIPAGPAARSRAIFSVFKKIKVGNHRASIPLQGGVFMKKYTKPSLTALGLLRVVTKFSACPGNEVPYQGTCVLPPCWIAAAVFGENFFTGPRVNKVRTWLVNDFEPSGPGAKFVMRLYRAYGQRLAKVVEKNSTLKHGFRMLFDKALAKAEAKYGTA
jgi:hypothetical protein